MKDVARQSRFVEWLDIIFHSFLMLLLAIVAFPFVLIIVLLGLLFNKRYRTKIYNSNLEDLPSKTEKIKFVFVQLNGEIKQKTKLSRDKIIDMFKKGEALFIKWIDKNKAEIHVNENIEQPKTLISIDEIKFFVNTKFYEELKKVYSKEILILLMNQNKENDLEGFFEENNHTIDNVLFALKGTSFQKIDSKEDGVLTIIADF